MSQNILDLNQSVRVSATEIKTKMTELSASLVSRMDKTNQELHGIRQGMIRVTSTLDEIKEAIYDIKKTIKMPNETEALELSNQARLKIAINNYSDALALTKRAMKKCSTSITVISYRLMTLIESGEDINIADLEILYIEYVNIIDVQLKDSESELPRIHAEILNFVFRTLFVVSRVRSLVIHEQSERLLYIVAGDTRIAKDFLTLPLKNHTEFTLLTQLTTVKDLIWTLIFNVPIKKLASYELIGLYLKKIQENDPLIKNDLIYNTCYLACEKGLFKQLLLRYWNNEDISELDLGIIENCLRCNFSNTMSFSNATFMLANNYIQDKTIEGSPFFMTHIIRVINLLDEDTHKYRNHHDENSKELRDDQERYLSTNDKEHSRRRQAIHRKQAWHDEHMAELNRQEQDLNNSITHHQKAINKIKGKLGYYADEVPSALAAIPAITIGFMMAAGWDKDGFGPLNTFFGVILSIFPGSLAGGASLWLMNVILSIRNSYLESRVNDHSNSIKEAKKRLEQIANDKKLPPAELDQLKQELFTESKKTARETLSERLKKRIAFLERNYQTILTTYYPLKEGEVGSKIDLDTRIKLKKPHNLDFETDFLTKLKARLDELRPDPQLNPEKLKEYLKK